MAPHRVARIRLPRIETAVAAVSLTVLTVTGAVFLPSATAQGRRMHVHPAPRARTAVPTAGKVSLLSVHDALARHRTRQVIVWRPDGDDRRTVPVVYFLHGLPGTGSDWKRNGAIARLQDAFRVGAAPFVAVFPDGNVPGGFDSEWADDARGRADLETFVTQPLIRAVEGTERRDNEHRAIAGFSMGGFAAAAIGLRHPKLYGQVAALAGYFHIDDPDHVFGSHAGAHDPSRLLQSARQVRLLLMDGDHDTEPVVRGETQRYARLLRAHRIPVVARITRGAHTVAWAVAQLPAMARFLSAGWGHAPAAAP
jgi:S-formylglutathione hydrolase FrmB